MRSKYNYNFCDLNLVLVVYTNKMAPVKFVLNELESSVTMGVGATIETSTLPTIEADAVAILQVSVEDMKSVFKYQTDSNDVTNENGTDIKYYTYSDLWPVLNPANAMLDAEGASDPIATANSSGPLESNKMLVAHDFVRYLALNLFNTHFGVDLFNNELELLNNLRLICDDSAEDHTWFDIQAKLALVGVNGTHSDIQGAIPGEKYMINSDEEDNTNLCRVLFQQMTGSAVERFSTIDATDGPQSLPFEVDDSISFKLIIAAADGQEELTSVAPIAPRSYEIRLVMVDAPDNTEVAADEQA
jgi:hypothetical protein